MAEQQRLGRGKSSSSLNTAAIASSGSGASATPTAASSSAATSGSGGANRITTALFNYMPECEGELALQRGKLVTLLSTDGNWWRGESQGEVGTFPRSFVRNPDDGSLTVSGGGGAASGQGASKQPPRLPPLNLSGGANNNSNSATAAVTATNAGSSAADTAAVEDLTAQLTEARHQLKVAEARAASLQLRVADAHESDRNGGGGSKSATALEETVAELRRELAMEEQTSADLRRGKASLESMMATRANEWEEERRRLLSKSSEGGVHNDGGGASSTLVEDLKLQLEKRKAEVFDLTAKKNKYKKHAKAADVKLREAKKKLEAGGGGGSASGDANVLEELEELRAAKAQLEKKLKDVTRDYTELEREVLALEEENSVLEDELGRKRTK